MDVGSLILCKIQKIVVVDPVSLCPAADICRPGLIIYGPVFLPGNHSVLAGGDTDGVADDLIDPVSRVSRFFLVLLHPLHMEMAADIQRNLISLQKLCQLLTVIHDTL